MATPTGEQHQDRFIIGAEAAADTLLTCDTATHLCCSDTDVSLFALAAPELHSQPNLSGFPLINFEVFVKIPLNVLINCQRQNSSCVGRFYVAACFRDQPGMCLFLT